MLTTRYSNTDTCYLTYDTVKLLVDVNADLNLKDKKGNTSIDYLPNI